MPTYRHAAFGTGEVGEMVVRQPWVGMTRGLWPTGRYPRPIAAFQESGPGD